MNHRFKLHPDGTLEITMPKGVKVGRVLVCEEGTQDGQIYYSDGLIGQYKWERDVAISQLHDLGYELGEKVRISAEPEPAIPLSWIEGQIKWLKSLDNAFSTLTAVQISAMVNKWRGEQE